MSTKYIVNNLSGQTINGNPIDPKYKVYTALLIQNGGSDNIGLYYNGDIVNTVIGVTYTIIQDGPLGTGYDFTVIGAPNNDIGTVFIATGTTPTWGIDSAVGLGYNAGTPVVTVLENTIGNVWFNFEVDGLYSMQSNGLFSTEKTLGFITYNDGGPSGLNDKPFLSIYPNNDYNIYVNSALNGVSSNGVLFNAPIEIRVYN